MVQDPAEAAAPDMPRNAISNVQVDLCAPLRVIAAALTRYALTPAPRTEPLPAPPWLVIENRLVTKGGGIQELKQIAHPSDYVCPTCGGVLFELAQQRPPRYRCHTGHSFTRLSLLRDQQAGIDESQRAALRALMATPQ